MKDASKPQHHPGTRDSFGSSFGVLVALAGSAVGLGNLWRFPYLVGQNGGAAFILIYLLFVFLLGLPILLSEFIIGRRSQASARAAFKALAPGGHWGIAGVLAVLCCTLIISFYSVVGGWGCEYLFKSLCFDFTRGDGSDLENLFSSFSTSVWPPLICHTVFLAATAGIVISGVKNGIEKFSKGCRRRHYVSFPSRLVEGYGQHFPGGTGAGVLLAVAGQRHGHHLRFLREEGCEHPVAGCPDGRG